MKDNLVMVCYKGESGSSDIRTFNKGDILYLSLKDILVILTKENRKLNELHIAKSLVNVLKAQVKILDDDEYIMIPNSSNDDLEVYVTQPGLYRVLSSDSSQAGKKFQRWLFHEVVPALTKYGEYPAPIVSKDSDVKRLAQTLLLEIEQREELERKTKEQFLLHEQRLDALGSKLESISLKSLDSNSFETVKEFCNKNSLCSSKEQLILGWCIKICAECGEPSKKVISNGKEEITFPNHVLINASKEAKVIV